MTTQQKSSTILNIVLWIAQGLIAMTLIWSGYMKITHPESLPFPWIKENPSLAMVTGVIDLLGGIGVILPALLRIQPKLTVFAAYGVVLLMISASIFHISRGEAKDIGFNIFMALIAVFVAWGRQTKAPIAGK